MRAMVVEDERMIRQGLMKHIKWKELGVQELCAASNAAEAFELARQFKPDIVLSDIRMPGMDGIEFCRRIRKDDPEIEIILVTGFSEKEYLKAAIDLHVVGFVEKPINVSVLSNLIMEAVERVKKTKQNNMGFAQNLLWDGNVEKPLRTEYSVYNMGLLCFQKEESLRLVKKNLLEELNNLMDGIGIQVRMNQMSQKVLSLLFCSRHGISVHPYFKEILKAFLVNTLTGAEKSNWFAAISEDVYGYEELPEAYSKARKTLDTLAWKYWNQIVYYSPEFEKNNAKFPADPSEPFQRAADLHDNKRMQQIVDEFANQLISGHFSIDSRCRYAFFNMMRILERDDQSREEELNISIDQLETIQEMQETVRSRIEQVARESGNMENSGTVRKIIEYMEQNYANPELSIRLLADEVYLTPTYLSSLFKKNTGKTIGQSLLEIRLKHAEELMKDPKLKFYQISRMVGYEDANYFAKIFKKKTGMTPSEYKEHIIS